MTREEAVARHPKGLYVLFFTELWERFGFYTMIAIFTLYMKAPVEENGLGLDTATAGSFYAIFMGLVYFTPLLGGLAADVFMGMRWAIALGTGWPALEFLGRRRSPCDAVASGHARRAVRQGIAAHVRLVVRLHAKVMMHLDSFGRGLAFEHVSPVVEAGRLHQSPSAPRL